jgi:hypothetical protein
MRKDMHGQPASTRAPADGDGVIDPAGSEQFELAACRVQLSPARCRRSG